MITQSGKPPAERYPAVTVVVLDADAPNLTPRLFEVAAQDYLGPLEVLAIAERDLDAAAKALAETAWVVLLPAPATGGPALELALAHARGEFLAILPRAAHPHALWIDELVTAAVEHPEAFAVAPAIVRPDGALLAAGAERGADGSWRARASAPGNGAPGNGAPEGDAVNVDAERVADVNVDDASEWIDAALGDGLLVSARGLAECLPLDKDLDARALGVDLSIRAKQLGRPLILAPRSRVVVGARGGDVNLETASRVLLAAKHDPSSLPMALGAVEGFAGVPRERSESILRQALTRAGISEAEATTSLFAATLTAAAVRAGETLARIGALEDKIRRLERDLVDSTAKMHREMAWSHELDKRAGALRGELDGERARFAAEAEAVRDASARDVELLRSRLADTQDTLLWATSELEGIRAKIEEGIDIGDLRYQELDARLKREASLREAAARERDEARERVRVLEDSRAALDKAQRQALDRRAKLEADLQSIVERAELAEARGKESSAELESASEERRLLEERVRAAVAGFEAASAALRSAEEEQDRLRALVAEEEARRDFAERLQKDLREAQESREASLRELSAQLTQARGLDKARSVKSAPGKPGEQGLADLKSEVQLLLGLRQAAERHAAELQETLTRALERAETAEARERDLTESLAAARGRIAELEAREGHLLAERDSLLTALRDAEAAGAALERELKESREAQARTEAELERTRGLLAAAERALAASRAEAGALRQELDGIRSRLAETLSALAATESRLEAEAAAHAATRAELVERTLERDAALGRAEALTRDLGGALADLAETRGLLAAARVALDETRSALTERLGDLATLRRQILRERDESAERIVGLIEDARVWRLVPRKLRGWEREFLEGPGAGFVRKKLR